MSCLAQANLRLLLPNGLVSPTPSQHCRYLPCTRTTDVAAGWIISSLLQSCISTIAMKRCLADYFRWFFQTQLYFPLFWKENPSHSLSPHLLLFSSTLTISSVSLGQTGRQCSYHLCHSGLRVSQKIKTHSQEHHLSTLLQLSREANARIKIHRTPDSYRKPGRTKISKTVSFVEIKFTSRPPQKSSTLLRGRRNYIHRPQQILL